MCSRESPPSIVAPARTTRLTMPCCAPRILACPSYASGFSSSPPATGAPLSFQRRPFGNATRRPRKYFFPAQLHYRPTAQLGMPSATCQRFPKARNLRCAGVGPSCFRQFPKAKITCGTPTVAVAARSSGGDAVFGISSSNSRKTARRGPSKPSQDPRSDRFTGITAASAFASYAAFKHFLTTLRFQAITRAHTSKSATPCPRYSPKSLAEKFAPRFSERPHCAVR